MFPGHSCSMTFAAQPEDVTPGELSSEQARPDHVAGLLMAIIAGFNLSDYERELVLQKLNEKNQAIATPRAGKTLSAVVEFCKQDRGGTFSLDDVRAAI